MTGTSVARLSAAALVLVGAIALAGCSGGEPESTTASHTPAAQAATSVPTAPPTHSDTAEEANAALDAYVALELAQKDTVMSTYAGVYSDLSVEAQYPDTVVYTYTFENAVDPDAAVATFGSLEGQLDSLCHDVVFPAMEQTGVTPTQGATFVYLNPDGTEIWSHSISSEDA